MYQTFAGFELNDLL